MFFDEIQECVEVVTYIKYLVKEGSYHYILSRSLLGVAIKNVKSEPVGYMDDVTMYPLDFEEFIVAVGERPELMEAARAAWESQKPLAKVYHDRLNKLLRLYLVVGGMPAAVQRYVDTKDIRQVVDEQKKILKYYRKDITKGPIPLRQCASPISWSCDFSSRRRPASRWRRLSAFGNKIFADRIIGKICYNMRR